MAITGLDNPPSHVRLVNLRAACGIVVTVFLCPIVGGGASASTQAVPANDNFADAIVLTGQSASRIGDTNVAATLEVGEADTVAGATGGASIWYSWTAPVNGLVRIDTLTSDFDTLAGVYTGGSVDALTEVASNDDCCSTLTSRVRFAAAAGTTYRIRVDGFAGSGGVVNLHLFETQPPANDDFSAARVLSGQTITREGDTNEGATLQAQEAATVAGIPGGASVWYAWTATRNGDVTIDTATSDFDTLLGVYTGTAVGSLTEIASGDDVKSGSTSLVRFTATLGTVYRIRVDGFDGDAGHLVLHLADVIPSPPPANDMFANAVVLDGRNVARTGDTNTGATLEAAEAATVAGKQAGRSVWYVWTAPVSAGVTIDTLTSGFDTLLGVYRGAAVANLTEIASNDDGVLGATSSVLFSAVAGVVYRIRVDGFRGDSGIINLRLVQAKAEQAITVTQHAPESAVLGSAFAVAAIAPGGQVTFSSAGSCSNVGAVFTMTSSSGTCSVKYDQFGGGDYNPAQQVDEVVAAQKVSQSIAVTANAPAAAAFGSSFTVAATAPGGTVTYSSTGACTNSGSTFTMTSGTGTCAVIYDQAGNGDIAAAPQVAETVLAQKLGQALTLDSHAPSTARLGASFVVAATAPGGSVTFSSSGSCSNAGAVFTMTSGSGSCFVMYDQAGDANFSAAPGLVDVVDAEQAPQAITVSVHAPANALAGNSFTVAASAPGGPVSFSSSGSCSNSGATFTMSNAAGTCSVKYDQSGNADYAAATQVVESVSVARPRFELTVTVSGAGSGRVASSVGGIDCGSVCSSDISAGTSVSLTASPASGSSFVGWSGACTGRGACTVTIDAAKDVVASFGRLSSVPRAKSCVVPRVGGKLLAVAKQRIAAAHCKAGKTTTVKSRAVRKGRVISQKPKAGTKLRIGAPVKLVVSRGAR